MSPQNVVIVLTFSVSDVRRGESLVLSTPLQAGGVKLEIFSSKVMQWECSQPQPMSLYYLSLSRFLSVVDYIGSCVVSSCLGS